MVGALRGPCYGDSSFVKDKRHCNCQFVSMSTQMVTAKQKTDRNILSFYHGLKWKHVHCKLINLCQSLSGVAWRMKLSRFWYFSWTSPSSLLSTPSASTIGCFVQLKLAKFVQQFINILLATAICHHTLVCSKHMSSSDLQLLQVCCHHSSPPVLSNNK